VDYSLRRKLLQEIHRLPPAGAAGEVMRRADEGLPKLWTIHQALCLRKEQPECFGAEAAYTPLEVQGPKAEHAIAYLRGASVATIVPRLTMMLGGEWEDTAVELPQGKWMNRLTGAAVLGGKVAMKEALRDFPVALLVRE
jgi:(1->4)-alpha-D-glucan 1-alpha-D-glucosylmutase